MHRVCIIENRVIYKKKTKIHESPRFDGPRLFVLELDLDFWLIVNCDHLKEQADELLNYFSHFF